MVEELEGERGGTEQGMRDMEHKGHAVGFEEMGPHRPPSHSANQPPSRLHSIVGGTYHKSFLGIFMFGLVRMPFSGQGTVSFGNCFGGWFFHTVVFIIKSQNLVAIWRVLLFCWCSVCVIVRVLVCWLVCIQEDLE